ncbi:MAG: hypothetical protein U0S48_07600 [Solirubrobacteraceae bacterium]
MGLLDDAIREHLELKRRHGADPSEVARQEREALGPARRGPEPLELPAQPQPEPEPADPALIEPQVDAPIYREPEDEAEDVPPAPAPPAPDLEPEPLAEAPPVEPEHSAAVPQEAEIDWDAPGADREPQHADVDQPTVAFDAVDIAEAERRPPREADDRPPPAHEPPPRESDDNDDDVLEETPDFLQETPEHDRLWFEQRPPRDFDFDG